MRCWSSIQDGKRLTMLPLPLCLCHGVVARKAKRNWKYITAEARNVLEVSGTKIWQEVSEIKNGKRLTMSPNQSFLLIGGLWLQKTPKGFASEVLGDVPFFFFFCVNGVSNCRLSVSVWPWLPAVAAFRDGTGYAYAMGPRFLCYMGEGLILIYNPMFQKQRVWPPLSING